MVSFLGNFFFPRGIHKSIPAKATFQNRTIHKVDLKKKDRGTLQMAKIGGGDPLAGSPPCHLWAQNSRQHTLRAEVTAAALSQAVQQFKLKSLYLTRRTEKAKSSSSKESGSTLVISL